MVPWFVCNAAFRRSRTVFAYVVSVACGIATCRAVNALHFVHNAAARLAFTAFAIACTAILGIKSVKSAVHDLHSAISVLRCPASPRKFPALAPCQSCVRIVVLDRGPTKKLVAVQPAKFNCRAILPFLSRCLQSFCQRTFGRIFACTTCHWLWLRWGTKLPVCQMACSCWAVKHVTE